MSSTVVAAPRDMRVQGTIRVPGDKSISHRYAMLAALADGVSRIEGYLPGADCLATLACLEALGVAIDRTRTGDDLTVVIHGRGARGLRAPAAALDAANSGTSMRLLAGMLAAHPFRSILVGDASLSRRPMRRVIEPLTRMGASIGSDEGHAPLTIDGGRLHGITHEPDVPSAQVKSAVLLAGLQADGRTVVREPAPTRDHTERAFEAFGVTLEREGTAVAILGGQHLTPTNARVPGDISSAVFWLALAAGTRGSSLTIQGVGLNPTRTAVLDILRRFGAHVETAGVIRTAGEPCGSIAVEHAGIRSVEIAPQEVPGIIDEIPALAALAAMGDGVEFTVRGARELRVKETDRIAVLGRGFRGLGLTVEEYDDGFTLGGGPPGGGTADAEGDHRLAMAFAIAATRARAPVLITGADAVGVSYPAFFEELHRLAGR
jgi:3-phosphoshikimate 1-carboxyvinyltransferase